MTQFTLSITPVEHTLHNQFRWCLDSPIHNSQHHVDDLLEHGLCFKGWLLDQGIGASATASRSDATWVVLQGSAFTPLPLNRPRADVLKKWCADVLHESTEPPACGFMHNIPLTHDKLTIGLLHNSEFYPLYKLHIQGAFQILQGADQWLFLDNDTNNSVDQFQGKTKLSGATKKEWQQYFTDFKTFIDDTGVPGALLVAPSKETVYPQAYPYAKQGKTPYEQILGVLPDSFPLCNIEQALSRSNERTFRMCDTHWSSFGALHASVCLASELGESETLCMQNFASDNYKQRLIGGDLGNKLFPPRKHKEAFLTSFNHHKVVVYDNGLPNFGRALVCENTLALTDKSLLVFGSSSSYSMLNYLCRIYQCVVLCHTAGSVDIELLTQLQPTVFAAQTNARFMVVAPKFGVKLAQIIAAKLEELSAQQQLQPKPTVKTPQTDFARHAMDLLAGLQPAPASPCSHAQNQ